MGTPIPITRLFWYLIGTLSVSVKRFQVKIASCYQGLGQSQQLTTPFSNAEYIEVGYVLQRHVTGFFIALKRTERTKLHRLVGIHHSCCLYDAVIAQKKDPMVNRIISSPP